MFMGAIGFTLFLTVSLFQSTAELGPQVNQPAPDFSLEDSEGRVHRLSDFRGEKAVVLEFFRSGSW